MSRVVNDVPIEHVIWDISPEAVTKLALSEEIRLLSGKIDRLQALIEKSQMKSRSKNNVNKYPTT